MQPLFGDIDPEECDEEFACGKDGMPRFVAASRESLDRRRKMLSALEPTCGPNGYRYILELRSGYYDDFDDEHREDEEDEYW